MARKKKTVRLAAIAAVNKTTAKEENKLKPEESQKVENNVCTGCPTIPREEFEDILNKINAQQERIMELEKRVGQLERTCKKEDLEMSQVKSQMFEKAASKEQEVSNMPTATIPQTKPVNIPRTREEPVRMERETFGYFETINSKKEQLFNEFEMKKAVHVGNVRKAGSLASIVTGSIREPPSKFVSKFVSKRLNPAIRRSVSNNSIDAACTDSHDSCDFRRHSAGRNAVDTMCSPLAVSGSAVDLCLARNALVKVNNKKVEDDIFISSIREEGLEKMGLESG